MGALNTTVYIPVGSISTFKNPDITAFKVPKLRVTVVPTTTPTTTTTTTTTTTPTTTTTTTTCKPEEVDCSDYSPDDISVVHWSGDVVPGPCKCNQGLSACDQNTVCAELTALGVGDILHCIRAKIGSGDCTATATYFSACYQPVMDDLNLYCDWEFVAEADDGTDGPCGSDCETWKQIRCTSAP